MPTQSPQAGELAEAVFKATWSCGHSIDAESVTLFFDPKQPGHNALNQLHRRVVAALSQPAPAAHTDLHDAIMNIPCDDGNVNDEYSDRRIAYKSGHRDARHAAAELALSVSAAPAAVSGPVAKLPDVSELLVWAVEDDLIRMSKIMDADLQDALVAYSKRILALAAPTAEKAEARPADEVYLGLCLDEDSTLHATVMRKESDGSATVLLSDYVRVKTGRDYILAGKSGDDIPAWPAVEERKPMSDGEIEALREKAFSTSNPFCPVDSKSMRKAVRATERAHGIGGEHG